MEAKMIPTRVETRLYTRQQIMEANTSKPLGTSWYNELTVFVLSVLDLN